MGVDSTQGSTPPPRDVQPARGSLIYAVAIALALLAVLAVALYGISSERTPDALPAAAPAPDASLALSARLGSLGEQLAAQAEHAAALRERVDALEHELARRPSPPSPPARAPASAAASPAPPADLDPLYARLSTIETSLEREGADRLESQEDLLARVYKLEASREDGTSARLAAQQAAEERVYQLEQRVHAAEAQLVEAEKRLAARIERLEAK